MNRRRTRPSPSACAADSAQTEERAALAELSAAGGLVDAYLALVSASLVPRLVRAGIERDYRKGTKPSDHAPLVVELA